MSGIPAAPLRYTGRGIFRQNCHSVRESVMSTIALTQDTFEDTDDVRARLASVDS